MAKTNRQDWDDHGSWDGDEHLGEAVAHATRDLTRYPGDKFVHQVEFRAGEYRQLRDWLAELAERRKRGVESALAFDEALAYRIVCEEKAGAGGPFDVADAVAAIRKYLAAATGSTGGAAPGSPR